MTNRTLGVALFLLLACATGFGQTSYKGLTPGTSTRNDVATVFGQPVRYVSSILDEHKPPAGIVKVEVEYGAVYSVSGYTPLASVERIEVYFRKPIPRAALLRKFSLPEQPEVKTTVAEGKLVEYFGGASLLVLTYASGDVRSGVSRVGYYSRKLFETAVSKLRHDKPTAPGSGNRPGQAGAVSPE